MPTRHRITHSEHDIAQKIGLKRARGLFASLSYSKKPIFSGVKMSVVVSKKVARRAVDRNYIKRKYRAILDQIVKNNGTLLKEPILIIIYPNQSCISATFDEIQNDIIKLLRSI